MYDETVKRGDALSISESKGLGTLYKMFSEL